MSSPNKRKGDVAERAVRDLATSRYPGSFKTRAGFNDDLGDVIVSHPAGRLVLQVKDVASPSWKSWRGQLADQVNVCRNESETNVVGGVIVHKYRGHSDPSSWHAVTSLGDLLDLLDEVYEAGERAGWYQATGEHHDH